MAFKSKRVQKKAGRRTLRTALVLRLKETEQARRGHKVGLADKGVADTATSVPAKERAGYPLVRTKVKPENWKTIEGKKVFVDLGRCYWLPDDWGQGVKMTNPIARTRPGGGGTYTVFISPEGRVFYHRFAVEDHLGRKLSFADGINGQMRMAQLQGKHTDEKKFFQLLSAKERKVLPSADEFHFCIVSARRTGTKEGIMGICSIEAQFKMAGVTPTWYVDAESLESYKALGLNAVVGGKLTEARNMCLVDAAKKGKACVQVSDDISKFEYHDGPRVTERNDDVLNAAWAAATVYVMTPVAAARFLLAKLRALDPDEKGRRPQLAGVYPLGSCARAFASDEFQSYSFIIGDFFVVDKSPVRFDLEMKLKEDYAFTCEHIEKHGGVLRANRMTITAKHQTNVGGACSNRDNKGKEEQRNIAILLRRWPRAFRMNPKRRNEVILKWPTDGDGAGKLHSVKDTKGPVASAKSSARRLVKKDFATKRLQSKSSAIVGKWTADTRIAYGPNLKKKGSSSFERYKKYAKAKTVGEALKLGAKRSDLVWDMERGMLKAK